MKKEPSNLQLENAGSSENKIQFMPLARDIPEMRYLNLDLSDQIQANKLYA